MLVLKVYAYTCLVFLWARWRTNQHDSYYFVILFKIYLRNMVAPPTCTFSLSLGKRFLWLRTYETTPNCICIVCVCTCTVCVSEWRALRRRVAVPLRSDSLRSRFLLRWSAAFESAREARLMHRVAVMHRGATLAHRFLAAWRCRHRWALDEARKLVGRSADK